MPNIEIFNESTGYISEPKRKLRESKLKIVENSSTFDIVVQNGKCIRFKNDIFPDLIVADWNTEIYFSDETIPSEEFVYGDIKYTKQSLNMDDNTIENYSIVLGRRFFSETNLERQRNSVDKIIRMIIGIWY